MELSGRVAVVTGGSKGIGKAVAARLAEEGADLVLAARTRETLEEAASAIAADTGRRVVAVATDLSGPEGCQVLHDRAVGEFERIDILINCAGATAAGPFLELPDEKWQEGFDLKFFGAVRLSRLFWPHLVASKGTVIMIDGGMARTPNPRFMIGGAVNAALANFGKALAGLGLEDDVNVNIIHPGQTRTERLDAILAAQASQAGQTVEEFLQTTIDRQGVRRLGKPEDVAELATFLCTPRARHIQGTAISVDGGATKSLF